MKTIYVIILAVCMVILVACSSETNISQTSVENKNSKKQTNEDKNNLVVEGEKINVEVVTDISKEEQKALFDITEENVNKIEKFEIVGYSEDILEESFVLTKTSDSASILDYWANQENIYYVEDIVNQGNYSKKIKIYKYDYKKDIKEIIYEYEDEKKGHNIICLTGNENYIFWTEMIESPSLEWEVKSFNINTLEVNVLFDYRDIDSELYPCISLKNNQIYWYVQLDNCICLYKYNLDNNQMEVIEENVYIRSPYECINENGKEVICTKYKENGNVMIKYVSNEVIIDVNTHLADIALIEANEKYIVWEDEYYNAMLYIFDISNKEFYQYNMEPQKEVILQIGFNENDILLKFNSDMNGNHNLYSLNPEKKLMKQLTNVNEDYIQVMVQNLSSNSISIKRYTHSSEEEIVFVDF